MKTTIITIVVVVAGILWIRGTYLTSPVAVGYNSNHLHVKKASPSHQHKNLQLYPIYASNEFLKHHRELGPYLSLKEALDQKKIEVTELEAPDHGTNSQQASVNELFVENISQDTIIILGGEVVRGGKQDRMIASDFMVYPHSGKINVNVFCVEHGRWTADSEEMAFDIAMDVAPSKVRKAASSKLSAQEKVWEEVAVINEGMGEDIRTGALAHAMEDYKIQASHQPYIEHLSGIKWNENVVGVIAVMNGEIVGCDIFAQHSLFTKYFHSLLSSYSPYGDLEDEQIKPQTNVRHFLNKLLASEQSLEEQIAKQGSQLKQGRFRIHLAAF